MGIFNSILSAANAIGDSNDGGCHWVCDECNAYMNDQPGFTVTSGSWTCTECGCVNDVSENNILRDSDFEDDDTGSYQYYQDEENRLQEEREDLFESGIDPDDD